MVPGGDDGDVGCLVNPMGISGEATKNSEPLDGRPETHGENEGHGVISMKFPFIFAKGCSNMVISTMVDSNPKIFIHGEGGGVPCTFPLCPLHKGVV